MKRKFSIPYVSWRDGRPRFQPGMKLRAQGFAGMDLRHPEGSKITAAELEPGTRNRGNWFGPGEAMDWSDAFSKRLAALQKQRATEIPGGSKVPHQPQNKPVRARATRATAPRGSYPLSRLIEDWQRAPEFRDLSPASRRDYANKMKSLAEDHPDIWASEIDALDRPIIKGMYTRSRSWRGNPMARGMMRVLSSAITWGLDEGKFRLIQVNPCLKLKMKTVPPRVRFATRAELETLVAAADHTGRADMGDSFIAAVWCGQRQGDRLALKEIEGNTMRLTCRQSKTGAIVTIPIAPEFQSRHTAARQRRRAAGIVSNHLILFETTWQPFNQHTYRHYFSEIRTVAVNGLWKLRDGTLRCPIPVSGNTRFKYLKHVSAGAVPGGGKATCLVEPRRSLADFQEMDFRDTAVTWLAMAGATVPEICAVTGHSVQSATQVLRHYLAMHPDMADSAISKMVAWFEKDGDNELGA